ncbi:MAG: hypothetical protein D3903_20095, partial [Candidatus Electrothrix sp. GM3_4]|nr:hypothetical protein [Candidatus Electrothrix sp. GM3_4]
MGYEEALRLIEKARETGATELDLSRQELTELPPELFQLTKLTSLDLKYNQIENIPQDIGQLVHLLSLDLDGNEVTELPSKLFQLKNLFFLGIGDIKLTTLPPEIVQLTSLTSLDIIANQLSYLPPELFQLINLTQLDLRANRLSSLPPEITQLIKLKSLWLYGNPLTSPPYELATQGIDAIREYFTSAEEGTQTVAEVKVILVGEGASGKTSLTRCLREEHFNPREETTHGIRIKPWQLSNGDQQLRCNLWDFGGQEIMHATHQFFLSRRSLYVLVLDGRRDERPEYWLRYIESFGGGSPVLVVL